MKAKINANGTEITVLSKGDENDFISLTDIARYKNPDEPKDVVKNWMRNSSTIEFLGLWEKLNNPNFKGVEFDSFIHEAGQTPSLFHRRSGFQRQMLLESFQKQVDPEELLHTKISPLSLHPGYRQSSSSTL